VGQHHRNIQPSTGSGGDYWISSLSAISKIYRSDEMNFLDEKIEFLQEKIVDGADKRINDMYQRNITFLEGFKGFDFQKIKPSEDLIYHKKDESKSVLDINGLKVKVMPNHLFSYTNNQNAEIGAIWFVAKLGGYKKDELGMFTDLLFRYLTKHFSSAYSVNPEHCIAIDISKLEEVRYSEIESGNVPILIDRTIEGIQKIL